MVAGSETTGEWRVQYYVPAYLLTGQPRPIITTGPCSLAYNTQFPVTYILTSGTISQYAPSLSSPAMMLGTIAPFLM